MWLQMGNFHCFLWLSNSPLCVCVCVYATSSLSIHQSMDTGCFRILLVVNSAVTNIGVHVSFQMGALIFLACVPQSGMTGSLSSSGFNVWEISRVSATAAAPT